MTRKPKRPHNRRAALDPRLVRSAKRWMAERLASLRQRPTAFKRRNDR